MKPILFSKNATSFLTNGIGRLNPTECLVAEERNGGYEAKLVVPRTDKYVSQVELGSKIRLMVSDGTIQTFVVYEIEKSPDDEIEISCQHISYMLAYIPVDVYSANTAAQAIGGIVSHSIVSNPFTFTTDIVSMATFEPKVPASARSYLGGMEGSMLDLYHGEYKFDNMNVYYYANRGTNSGVTIRWGKNITKLETEKTDENVVDGIVPYWSDGSHYVVGDILKISGHTGDKISTEDVSSNIELSEGQTVPTKNQVNTAGTNVLAKKTANFEETLKVEYKQNPEIENVQLCDIVKVIYEPYGIEVELKVVKTIWDVLREKYDSIQIGDNKSFGSVSNTINSIIYEGNNTRIRLERTENGLISEVSRATEAEGALSTTIEQTADYIISEAARSVTEYDETGVSIDLYGYGEPWDAIHETGYKPSENNGKVYLDRSTGYYYTCNGTVWVRSQYPLPTINAQLNTRITQTATEITQEVSGAFNQYEMPWNLYGDTFDYYDYGEPDELDYPPSITYYNSTYFDVLHGNSYKCLYDPYTALYYWSIQSSYFQISVSVYNMGQPSQDTAAMYPNQYYLDESSGYVYISENIGGTYTWHYDTNVYPFPARKITDEVRGELSLKLDRDDDGRIVSLLTASANYIRFNADNMFTVDAPNFSVDHQGVIEANSASLRNTTSYYADIYNETTHEYEKVLIGDFGLTNVGGQYGDTGIGIRNAADSAAVVMGPSTGNLWFKGAGEVIYLGAYGLLPWSGTINLGSSSYRWGKLWVTDIDTVNAVVVSSDKRMKNVQGTIDKVREFYMSLKPLQYTFKEGVHKDTNKIHYGLVAQEVLESYEKCYNSDEQEIVVKVEADDSTKEVIGDDMKYALDYNELHAFHIAMIQELRAEIDELKAEIKALKEGDKR